MSSDRSSGGASWRKIHSTILTATRLTPITDTDTLREERKMSDPNESTPDVPLNPALKSRTETVYETRTSTPAPIDTASASEGEGEGWPWIWLVVTLICVALAAYFLI